MDITSSKIDQNLANALPGLCANSGYDSWITLHGIRNIKWFKKVFKSDYYQSALALFGDSVNVHSLEKISEQLAWF